MSVKNVSAAGIESPAAAAPCVAGDQDLSLNLRLQCADNNTVLLSSALLIDTTRNSAFKAILRKLQSENPSANSVNPMGLDTRDDTAAVWEVVWNIIHNPSGDDWQGLNWKNFEAVILLAHKYELLLVLVACEAMISTALAISRPAAEEHSAQSPFGKLLFRGCSLTLTLSLLEVLTRAGMTRTVNLMLPFYSQILNTTTRTSTGRHVATQALCAYCSHLPSHFKQDVGNMHQALLSYKQSSQGATVASDVIIMVQEQMLARMVGK